jgi:hypothetical protein
MVALLSTVSSSVDQLRCVMYITALAVCSHRRCTVKCLLVEGVVLQTASVSHKLIARFYLRRHVTARAVRAAINAWSSNKLRQSQTLTCISLYAYQCPRCINSTGQRPGNCATQ